MKYMRFIDLEYKGVNIQQKYFKDEIHSSGFIFEDKQENQLELETDDMPF